MLVAYHDDQEKIAMGLLSLIPDLKDPTRVKEEIEWYKKTENCQLFFWKKDIDADCVGILGTEVGDELLLIRHLSLNPSFRNEDLHIKIIQDLQTRFPDKKMMGTLDTASYVSDWEQRKED